MNKQMKNISILLLLFCTSLLSAQTNKNTIFGLNASADFGRFQDRIEMTPTIAFRTIPKLYLGFGTSISYYSSTTYIYSNKNNTTVKSSVKDKTWYIGGELFVRYLPFEGKKLFINNIFLQASYEALWGNGNYKDKSGKYSYNTTNHTPFIGVGYKQRLIKRLAIGVIVNIKLNNENHSPYRNPVVKVALEF